MNKKVSNQLEKIIISVMIFLVLAVALFILTSCKSDYQKTLEGDTASGANTTNQAATSEKETAAETSESWTETTAATETTSETTNPAQQIVEVTARSGGYSPRKIEAKAGIPTILVMKSEGAYGCERAFNIPDLNIIDTPHD